MVIEFFSLLADLRRMCGSATSGLVVSSSSWCALPTLAMAHVIGSQRGVLQLGLKLAPSVE